MCDYCDCRLVPAIADLTADHERLLDLTTQLRALLARHTRREEEGIFSALRDVGAGEYVDRFDRDHAVVESLLDELEGHIAVEESDLFPAARQLLGPAEWDEVERTHQEIPSAIGAST
jgi:hemerythrin-like domain-containing protein